MIEEEAVLTDSEPISSCSVSSLVPHCSSDDLRENAENLGNSRTEEVSKTARTRKLLDKLSRGNQLLHQPKLTHFSENIDLSTPTDHVDLFAQQFPHLSKQRPKRLAAASEKPKNGTDAQKRVKEQLSARLAARRRAEQEKRRALYNEDNEDVLGLQDDEEEEEILEVKKKTKLKKPKPVDSDNSEDDEDYKEEDEEGAEDGDDDSGSTDEEVEENSEDESAEVLEEREASQETIKESVDLFDTENESPMKPLDLQESLNIPETVPMVPVQIPESPTQFPSSLSQWWTGSQKPSSSQPPMSQESVVIDDGGGEIADKQAVAADDLLMFCSGQFDAPLVVPQPFEKSTEEKKQPEEAVLEEEEDEDIPVRHASSKKRTALQSDDEDDGAPEEPKKNEEVVVEEDPVEETVDVEKMSGNRRAVLLSDDESDKEEDEDQEDEEAEESEEEEEEEEEEKESEKEEEADDSDNELATFKRMQREEYKKKSKLDTFVEEEADLSGDDVGSDADEDGEGNNEYEAEECDAELFDSDDLRRKNHKLFMKQEQQQIHRDIAKLQDRLLADGDLAGVETNRSFRVKLRTEEETIDFSDVNEFSQDSSITEEEAVEDEKQRAEAIKFKVEMQQKIAVQRADEPMDDIFEVAASAALKAETSVTETRVAPTLLGKAPLAAVIKDLSGGIVVKQLYTSTADSAGTKRPSDVSGNVAKKHKLNLLDSLDD